MEFDLQTVSALIDRMVEKGVRRVKWCELEIELDPAAQLINAPDESEPSEDAEQKRADGLCVEPTCKEKSGWLNTAFCKAHFKRVLNAGN